MSSAQLPQTKGDTQYNVRDAALLGASSAFAKPALKPKPLPSTYTSGNNGALLAAAKAGSGMSRSAPSQPEASPLQRDGPGATRPSKPPSPPRLPTPSTSSRPLGMPEGPNADRTPSPSNIAAKIAAARFSPMKPSTPQILEERSVDENDMFPPPGSVSNVLAQLEQRPLEQAPLRRPGNTQPRSSTASTIHMAEETQTDSEPLPPASGHVRTPAEPPAAPRKQVSVPPVRSPKPQRAYHLSFDEKVEPPRETEATLVKLSEKPKPAVKPKPGPVSMDSGHDGLKLRKEGPLVPLLPQKSLPSTAAGPIARPKPPQQEKHHLSEVNLDNATRPVRIQSRVSSTMSVESTGNASSASSYMSAQEQLEEVKEKGKPVPPPPRRSTKGPSGSLASRDRPKAAPEPPQPLQRPASNSQFPLPISRIDHSSPVETALHSNYQRQSAKQVTRHLTGESLSNAMIGAALASSRTASPGPTPALRAQLPPRKHHPHHPHHPHHHHLPLHHDRSPSPQKPTGKLRTTLRKEPSSSDEKDDAEKYKRKGTRVMGMRKKHPNKHHEGTRKRWRDIVTERERKRYEGVWAANKGLYIPSSDAPQAARSIYLDDPAHDVLNLVVREIWQRSRLADHVLEEVWDLVDARGLGRLRREEFVVGMWLIDQRLKGRKLPLRVSESVWGSVRGAGVKIRVRR
ncbi:uncharacterized protein EI97DRAFT_430844 [Westerdykella ornata]|uniref:EH domain-containing protein n=1 Tax=Westerdykella ornata TaxID=318751 RepID=A0A6A6JS64_WESOR|nr:uncharacterized protein EI97DRAFT_430844 [Westerdykella ornata]KAF2278566.1 hypothetical protein EI97DRAFT_430844 [Westerdykella ornata]